MNDIEEIKRVVQDELDQWREKSGVQLEIIGESPNGLPDLIELIVRSKREGVHAHQYAQVLAEVEEAVKQRLHTTVVLVPAA